MEDIREELFAGYAGGGRFGHRQHLHMTWSYLCRGEGDKVLPFLRHVADSHGDHDKLNVTMTRFWVGATAHGIRTSGAESFDALLDAVPHLLDKTLPFRHWSRDTLFSPKARAEWVEPDLEPLPF
jgi:hypothetical protein